MCKGHYFQGVQNESSPPRPWNLIITTRCVCVGKPGETSVAIATHSMVWRGSHCEERIRKGWPPRGVRIPFSGLWSHIISFPLTYECEKWTDHTFSSFIPIVMTWLTGYYVPPCFVQLRRALWKWGWLQRSGRKSLKRLEWSGSHWSGLWLMPLYETLDSWTAGNWLKRDWKRARVQGTRCVWHSHEWPLKEHTCYLQLNVCGQLLWHDVNNHRRLYWLGIQCL